VQRLRKYVIKIKIIPITLWTAQENCQAIGVTERGGAVSEGTIEKIGIKIQ